jgi:hypothetical protein
MAWRIWLLVAWMPFIWFLPQTDVIALQIVSVVGTVLVGALVARWWAVLAPVVLGMGYLIFEVLWGEQTSDGSPLENGLFGLMLAVPLVVLIALGVGIGTLVLRGRSGAQDDRRLGVGRAVPHP